MYLSVNLSCISKRADLSGASNRIHLFCLKTLALTHQHNALDPPTRKDDRDSDREFA